MKILISAGPMRTAIDPIRYVQNASSGVLGVELAAAFKNLVSGCDITMMLGPVDSSVLSQAQTQATVCSYLTPADYQQQLEEHFPHCDLFVSAAAVLDFEIIPSHSKIARETLEATENISLQKRNVPDFAAWAGAIKKPHQKILAFALATEGEAAAIVKAQHKVKAKQADWIYLNFASATQGPGKALSQGLVLDKLGQIQLRVPEMNKRDVAKTLASFVKSHIQGDQT